ncbi:hypothetical protein RJ639_047042 [Escallonia herrerae]|uniref:Cytochrome P450 n=1 Tax=Escallonia herrerae TaxID=1293975 RepID=A0AA89B284_9ASTE|nr:hypothetical protein RJ639_047042 [Escallonia herrerae]
MLPAIDSSCSDLINKWDSLVSPRGSGEIDVWPYMEDLSGDIISRTAFGSNQKEGRRIFQLQKEQVDLALQLLPIVFIPGWRFIPTKANKRMKEVISELQILLKGIIKKREKAMEMGMAASRDDLLGILMESNFTEIQEHGIGMSIEEVISECKLFYFAGSSTTSSLMVWTMVLLSQHPDWQARAREEVFQVSGNGKLDFAAINSLKTPTKLGSMTLPARVEFTLPTLLLHQDIELWGEDAKEFKPERFSEGLSHATKGKLSFLPFGGGPRICIGQNLAMIEAKMAIATILRHFSFELSPAYAHAPFPFFTLHPQHGAPLISHKL